MPVFLFVEVKKKNKPKCIESMAWKLTVIHSSKQ